MTLKLRSLVLTLAAIVCLSASLPSLRAQDETLGSLTLGQPVSGSVSAEEPARYTYTLAESSVVTLQVISETAQPTVTILKDGLSVASEPNEAGDFVTSLSTYLANGEYEVEIGTANAAEGTIVAVVQSETPVQVTELVPGVSVTGEMSADTAVAIYHLPALAEPSIISLTSGVTIGGVTATLWNEDLNWQSGTLSGDLLGGTFQLRANGATYRLEISYSRLAPLEPYTLCWYAASAGSCTGPANPDAISTATQSTPLACTVTPASGAVNVRSSASTSAPIVASLAFGASADVIGLSPDGTFYNIQLTNTEGWVATSVVNTGGECSNVPLKNPPDFVPVPTATAVPAQPTQPAATLPPTATATVMASATPSGPCLLTLNSPVKVYSEPIEKVDFLYDQVQSGELIPVGRLADGSWWKTNYANAWVPTYLFGGALTVSGNCALPIVQP